MDAAIGGAVICAFLAFALGVSAVTSKGEFNKFLAVAALGFVFVLSMLIVVGFAEVWSIIDPDALANKVPPDPPVVPHPVEEEPDQNSYQPHFHGNTIVPEDLEYQPVVDWAVQQLDDDPPANVYEAHGVDYSDGFDVEDHGDGFKYWRAADGWWRAEVEPVEITIYGRFLYIYGRMFENFTAPSHMRDLAKDAERVPE